MNAKMDISKDGYLGQVSHANHLVVTSEPHSFYRLFPRLCADSDIDFVKYKYWDIIRFGKSTFKSQGETGKLTGRGDTGKRL